MSHNRSSFVWNLLLLINCLTFDNLKHFDTYLCPFYQIQAKVDWPADMPDDMLEEAITVSKKALEEHDFEEEGVTVSRTIPHFRFNFL